MFNKKIIIGIVVVVALIIAGKLLYNQLVDYCPRCKNPATPNEVLRITNGNTNLSIVYSKNNGSLPPQYHREDVFTVTTDEKGTISAEHTVKDYKEVLEKKPLIFSHENLNQLLGIATKIDSKSNDSANLGCTGGSNKAIKISQKDKILLETSSYNCGGKSTNESLEKFSADIEKILAE